MRHALAHTDCSCWVARKVRWTLLITGRKEARSLLAYFDVKVVGRAGCKRSASAVSSNIRPISKSVFC